MESPIMLVKMTMRRRILIMITTMKTTTSKKIKMLTLLLIISTTTTIMTITTTTITVTITSDSKTSRLDHESAFLATIRDSNPEDWMPNRRTGPLVSACDNHILPWEDATAVLVRYNTMFNPRGFHLMKNHHAFERTTNLVTLCDAYNR